MKYKGLKDVGVNYMSLLFKADCDVLKSQSLKRELRRELKLMLDRNGIKKPKPTMYLSQGEYDD